MGGLQIPPNAAHLGTQTVEITEFRVYPAWQLEALDYAPIDGPFDVSIRLVLPKLQRALLLPCSVLALRSTVRALDKVASQQQNGQ